MSQKTRQSGKEAPFPSKADILRFIEESPDNIGKREIARAFHIRGDDRKKLKTVLREMADDGLIQRGHNRSVERAGQLPAVTVIEINETDIDGELMARPDKWEEETPPPPIIVIPDRKQGRSLGIGDRVLARLKQNEEGVFEARVIKQLEPGRDKILGVYRREKDGGGRVIPTDKRARHDYTLRGDQDRGAEDGELVLAEVLSNRRNKLGLKPVRVIERIGRIDSPKSTSLIAIHTHGIPNQFDPDVEKEAQKAKPVDLGQRTDLRGYDLITIDPADARDHDDAVYAEPDEDEKNPGGWHVIVAIADVAHYVKPDSLLDKSAYERGNSVYFPDRVVPMLPEELSADLCSLVPDKDRACMAAHLWFDSGGNLIGHEFVRGLMRSRANLSYEQVQAAIDGNPGDEAAPILDTVLKPLYSAFNARMTEREKREPLDIDMPERRVELDDEGNVARITIPERLDAHRVIEEFMIAANVAAASELEKHRAPCLYRVHETPPVEKLESLREFLGTLDLSVPKAQHLQPKQFNRVLDQVEGTAHDHLVNTVVLRSQSQAYYSPSNLGHFGLNLNRYAHFTSPIRRYADLIVHRSLIRALKLGNDGLGGDVAERLDEIGEHISVTERRAMTAERDANDRYMAAYMSDRVGAQFEGKIVGVTRFGLFVEISENGAEGLIPMRSLKDDFYHHDEHQHALIGERTGVRMRLGDRVMIKLLEATPITGGMRFELLDNLDEQQVKKSERPSRGRPAGGKAGRPKSRRNKGKPKKKAKR